MDILMDFVHGTPWYVYLIVLYLIFVGIKSIKSGIVPLRKLFIVPIIFSYLTYNEIVHSVNLNSIYLMSCISALIVGSIIGGWQFSAITSHVDKVKKTVYVKGNVISLLLMIITFSTKYYVAYSLSLNQNMSVQFIAFLIWISSMLTGLFIGRVVYVLYKMYK